MVDTTQAFSGFSVDDITSAQKFYDKVLGVKTKLTPMGLQLLIRPDLTIFVYEKKDHTPASFTILNFPVNDIDAAVKELTNQGVTFEQYEGLTDKTGVARGLSVNRGPDIAWFKDPAGNILSILQDH